MKHHNPISTNIHKEVLAAEKRIRPHIRKTYLEYSPYLSSKVDGRVYLKLECLQHTGSFKYRGALNKFLSLSPEDRQDPVITASSGNHGTALASILQKFNGKGVVYLPENASPAKVNKLRQYGVELKFFGTDCIMSETLAKETSLMLPNLKQATQLSVSDSNIERLKRAAELLGHYWEGDDTETSNKGQG